MKSFVELSFSLEIGMKIYREVEICIVQSKRPGGPGRISENGQWALAPVTACMHSFHINRA